jgi:hypothetical protein
MKFTAFVVEPDKTEKVATLIFADPETDSDEPAVLMFSRAIDIPDGNYYFEVNDQSNSSYGGLESVRVSRNKLQVKLMREVVEEFGVDDFENLDIEFDVDDEMYQSVLDSLKTIFDGHDILKIE